MTKTCRSCGHTGPLDDFMRAKANRDGRGSLCHECNRAKARQWTRDNPERNARRSKEWAQANPDRKREYDRAWLENNRERANAASREWAEKNREKRREIVRRSDLKHAERRRAYGRAYSAALDPEVKREQQRKWKARNRDKVALDNHRRRSTGDVDEPSYRLFVRALQADPCAYCGAPPETVDHITPLAADGVNEWTNLTSACARCNSSKGTRPLLVWLATRTSYQT